MAADRHSRLVGRAKVLLPLAALALLSSLVLFSEEPSPDVAVQGTGERRIGSPDFAGVTEEGARISVSADLARPEGGGAVAEGLAARIDEPGRSAFVRGAAGTIDEGRTRLALRAGTLSTSDGYSLSAREIEVALTRTLVTGRGEVEGLGPGTRIEAGALRMDDATLSFTGGVRLVYRPSD